MKISIITVLFLLIFSSNYSNNYNVSYYNPDDTIKITRNIISLFPTKANKINGFCFGFSHNKKRTINGLNIEIFGARFTEYFVFMLSRKIYPERFATVNGLTISFNPIYNKVNGVGIFPFLTEIYTFNGLAIAGFNGVETMHGVQIGFMNTMVKGKGLQIGLFNTIMSNPVGLRKLPLINFTINRKTDE